MANDLRSMLTDRLKRLVPVTNNQLPRGAFQAQVIAVAASKGGVGKTTTAVSVAAGLAKFHGAKVLLVDLDSQGHVGASLRSVAPSDLHTVSQILLEREKKGREMMEVAYPSNVDGLFLTPPDKTLNDTESLLSTKIGKEFILRSALELTRTHYDFIVLDCPPNLGNLTLNALLAADHLLIPSDLTVLSLEGVGDILQTVETISLRLNHRVNVVGVLPTRVDRRNKSLNETMGQSLQDLYGDLVLSTEIPVTTAVNRAQLEGKTLYDYDASSTAAIAYKTLVGELVARLSPKTATAKRA